MRYKVCMKHVLLIPDSSCSFKFYKAKLITSSHPINFLLARPDRWLRKYLITTLTLGNFTRKVPKTREGPGAILY